MQGIECARLIGIGRVRCGYDRAAEQAAGRQSVGARYGEAFAYDADAQMFSLENPS